MPIAMRSRRTLLAALIAGSAVAIAAGPAAAAPDPSVVPVTQVTGTVGQYLSLKAPDAITLPSIPALGTSEASAPQNVTVIANTGYILKAQQMSGPPDAALAMHADTPDGALYSDVLNWGTFAVTNTTQQPVLGLGGRAYGGTTSETGDVWPVSFKATTLTFAPANKSLSWNVQFTVATN